MEAINVFTKTPEQHTDLVRKFIGLKGVCSHSRQSLVGMNHQVTCCSHREYDSEQAPNLLCLFDYCPIIQEEVLHHVRP
jgi:hypothetical protein